MTRNELREIYQAYASKLNSEEDFVNMLESVYTRGYEDGKDEGYDSGYYQAMGEIQEFIEEQDE